MPYPNSRKAAANSYLEQEANLVYTVISRLARPT